jgi:hypothetical protein
LSKHSSLPCVHPNIFLFWVDGAHVMRCEKDKHRLGEVYLENWKEGGKTIQAGPTAKFGYFVPVDSAQENGKANGNKRARVD